jgi:hypothetical protein
MEKKLTTSSFMTRVCFLLLIAITTIPNINTNFVVVVVAFRSSTKSSFGRIRIGSPRSLRIQLKSLVVDDNGDGNDDDEKKKKKKNDITSNNNNNISNENENVDSLLTLLSKVPSNVPTPKSLTDDILIAVRTLEKDCPTNDDRVLSELAGNWQLLWTTQDQSNVKGGWASFINPLENQSYSNNPLLADDDGGGKGRANPILPREIQDVLERTGILEPAGGTTIAPIRSSQSIDIKKSRVRNVVNVQIKKPFPVKGSLLVDVNFHPNDVDRRRIDVKFDSCRFIFKNANIDWNFPLGPLGPTGWLKTNYIDDKIRITRGHKGSVFILSRTVNR